MVFISRNNIAPLTVIGAELLSGDNKKQFLIPREFAHGFLTLPSTVECCYGSDDSYHPNAEGGMTRSLVSCVRELWVGEYKGAASAEGYTLDGVVLSLSDKDQKRLGITDTFKY